MITTAYHASPFFFEDFENQKHGIHVGSYQSALEAVQRKTSNEFYLYTVRVDTSCFVEEFDHGYDWESVFKYEPQQVKGYIYQNRYEPSHVSSYVSWVPEQTMTITKVELMRQRRDGRAVR